MEECGFWLEVWCCWHGSAWLAGWWFELGMQIGISSRYPAASMTARDGWGLGRRQVHAARADLSGMGAGCRWLYFIPVRWRRVDTIAGQVEKTVGMSYVTRAGLDCTVTLHCTQSHVFTHSLCHSIAVIYVATVYVTIIHRWLFTLECGLKNGPMI